MYCRCSRTWHYICIVYEIDQCRYFITVLTIFICYKTKMPNNRQIVDVIYMHLQLAALPWYYICIVLQIDQCRYFITVITIFICYKIEMQDNRHIADDIYLHLFKFIYRLYRYEFHEHLILLFIFSEMLPSGYDSGHVSWRPYRVGGSNPTVYKIFFNVYLFFVPRGWIGSVQMKASMTFIQMCIEREK